MSNLIQYQSKDIIWKVDDENELRAYHIDNLRTPVVWAPQPGSQQAFLACPVREVLIEGNRGGGKTDVLLMDFARDVGRGLGPDWTGVLFRRTYVELEDIARKSRKWFLRIFPDATFNKSTHTWTFRDGEQLILSYANSLDDYDKHHGHQYAWIGWEELTNWATDELFKKLITLNRTTNSKVKLRIRSTCNPGSIGHQWVRTRYGLPSLPGVGHTEVITEPSSIPGQPGMQRIAIQSRLDENIVLLHSDPSYIDTVRAGCSTPDQEQAWVYGSWDVTSGGMFDDVWQSEYQIIQGLEPHMIPQNWRIDRSYDHGQGRPFSVGFWAQSNGEPLKLPNGKVIGQVRGDLFRIAEWYGCDPKKVNTGLRMSAIDIADGIQERIVNMGLEGRVRAGPADASIFDEVEPKKSVAGDMKRRGLKWLAADKSKGSRAQGWQQMRTLLRGAVPIKQPDGNYIRETPGLFISSQCKDFLRTIPTLPRDDKNTDDVNTKVEDHIADEVRYRCRARLAKRTRVTKG